MFNKAWDSIGSVHLSRLGTRGSNGSCYGGLENGLLMWLYTPYKSTLGWAVDGKQGSQRGGKFFIFHSLNFVQLSTTHDVINLQHLFVSLSIQSDRIEHQQQQQQQQFFVCLLFFLLLGFLRLITSSFKISQQTCMQQQIILLLLLIVVVLIKLS